MHTVTETIQTYSVILSGAKNPSKLYWIESLLGETSNNIVQRRRDASEDLSMTIERLF